jgi:hypothetical protein
MLWQHFAAAYPLINGVLRKEKLLPGTEVLFYVFFCASVSSAAT